MASRYARRRWDRIHPMNCREAMILAFRTARSRLSTTVRKFIIMGIQVSGKGTQAKLLADDLDLEHFSVGDIFRWNVQHHTKFGAQVKRITASGKLVDDDLVESVVGECLADHDWNFGFVIDGFPRTARQAEFFLER